MATINGNVDRCAPVHRRDPIASGGQRRRRGSVDSSTGKPAASSARDHVGASRSRGSAPRPSSRRAPASSMSSWWPIGYSACSTAPAASATSAMRPSTPGPSRIGASVRPLRRSHAPRQCAASWKISLAEMTPTTRSPSSTGNCATPSCLALEQALLHRVVGLHRGRVAHHDVAHLQPGDEVVELVGVLRAQHEVPHAQQVGARHQPAQASVVDHRQRVQVVLAEDALGLGHQQCRSAITIGSACIQWRTIMAAPPRRAAARAPPRTA